MCRGSPVFRFRKKKRQMVSITRYFLDSLNTVYSHNVRNRIDLSTMLLQLLLQWKSFQLLYTLLYNAGHFLYQRRNIIVCMYLFHCSLLHGYLSVIQCPWNRWWILVYAPAVYCLPSSAAQHAAAFLSSETGIISVNNTTMRFTNASSPPEIDWNGTQVIQFFQQVGRLYLSCTAGCHRNFGLI